jgi:hypothetical protein
MFLYWIFLKGRGDWRRPAQNIWMHEIKVLLSSHFNWTLPTERPPTPIEILPFQSLSLWWTSRIRESVQHLIFSAHSTQPTERISSCSLQGPAMANGSTHHQPILLLMAWNDQIYQTIPQTGKANRAVIAIPSSFIIPYSTPGMNKSPVSKRKIPSTNHSFCEPNHQK